MMNEMKKTLFIDIDGSIIKHKGNLSEMFLKDIEVLPGVLEKFNEWDAKGYKIILTTGRKECLRKITEDQLLKNGIFFDQLVMGLTRGERVLINDIKPNNDMSVATAIQINRNEGLKNIEI
jgi:beta-phosphoglucomutase-like phosphatase (HAD superfamily)